MRSKATIGVSCWLGVSIIALTILGCSNKPTGNSVATLPTNSEPDPNPYEIAIANDFKAATDAVERDPKSAEAHAERGRAHMRAGRMAEALADFNLAVELRPVWAIGYAWRAECLFAQGNTEQAKKDSYEAIRLDPNCSEGYLARAVLRLADKDQMRSLEDCNQAVLLSPLSPKAYLIRGIVQRNSNSDRALADFNDAIRLDKLMVSAYYQRGLVYARKQDTDMAILDWREVVRLNPKCGNGHIALGMAYRFVGDDDAAIAELATGLACNNSGNALADAGMKHLSFSYNSRACLMMQKKLPDRAEPDLLESVRINPDAHMSHIYLAEIYCNKGRYDDAIRHMDDAARIIKTLDSVAMKKLQEMWAWPDPTAPERLQELRLWTEHRIRENKTGHALSATAPILPTPQRVPEDPVAITHVSQTSGKEQGATKARKPLGSFVDTVFTKENLQIAVEIGIAAAIQYQNRPPKVQVEGYWREGTYVKPHERSFPRR